MASTPLDTKPFGGRPPFFGGSALTTFAPDPEENPDYLVDRAGMHVSALEHHARQGDSDPETVLELLDELYAWILHLLELERALSLTFLPPGNGALYSIEYLLDSESEAISAYKKLLARLDDARPIVENELKLKNFLGLQGDLG